MGKKVKVTPALRSATCFQPSSLFAFGELYQFKKYVHSKLTNIHRFFRFISMLLAVTC